MGRILGALLPIPPLVYGNGVAMQQDDGSFVCDCQDRISQFRGMNELACNTPPPTPFFSNQQKASEGQRVALYAGLWMV
jgi:hypothetical protein